MNAKIYQVCDRLVDLGAAEEILPIVRQREAHTETVERPFWPPSLNKAPKIGAL
jgi:hypothetical protein